MRSAEDVISEALDIVSQLDPRMRDHVARLAVDALIREGLLVRDLHWSKSKRDEMGSPALCNCKTGCKEQPIFVPTCGGMNCYLPDCECKEERGDL